MEYYEQAGLIEPLEALGFHLVGYGCTTCIGNSGPLPEEIADASTTRTSRSSRCSSGNRNFEGRINPDVKMNYLASPPLSSPTRSPGRWTSTCSTSRSAQDADGEDVYLKDIWPSRGGGRARSSRRPCSRTCSRKSYDEVFDGDERWNALDVPEGDRFAWDERLDLRAPAAVLRGHARRSPSAVDGHRGRARARRARRLGHDRPHLARGRDQEGLAGRRVPQRARRRAARTSTPTARAAATTR